MSSKNGTSKHRHHNSKGNSAQVSLQTSNRGSSLSAHHSSPSNKPRKEHFSSPRSTDFTAPPATSSKMTHPSYTTSLSTFDDTRTDNSSTAPSQLTNTEVDLLGLGTWTQAYPQHYPYHFQASNFAYPLYGRTDTSACPYHTTMMGSGQNNIWSGSEVDLAPLERWAKEDVTDGGALPLGVSSNLHCTCRAI